MRAGQPRVDEPVESDVDLSVATRGRRPARGKWPVVAAVAVGGMLGAVARYGASLMWPTSSGGFPWTTLTVNVVGCALIGVLMVVISDVRAAHRLARPFFGTGVLGGFTTFSALAVELVDRVDSGRVAIAAVYLVVTLAGGLAVAWAGLAAGERVP
jgi:CrcB protein